jgi:MoaA/NifB/PqqE/SkfB family radical SAM enzyme
LTNACDLRCPYCYAPKSADRLEAADVVQWLSGLDAGGSLGVGFGGGEPTLHPDFAGICAALAKSTGLAVTFTTHGHTLDDRLLGALSGNVHFIRLSMDGVGPTYESLRRRPFHSFLRRLNMVREFAPFGINYVVNEDTLADLDAALALAGEVGASEFLLLPERPVRGRQGIDVRTRLALREQVRSHRGTVRLAISQPDSVGFPVDDPFVSEQGLLAYAHIDASGTLRRSSYSPNGVAIGSDGIMAALATLSQRY